MLELAGVLTWQHRIARIQVRERDLFGRMGEPLARHPHLAMPTCSATRSSASKACQLPSRKIRREH